MKGSEEKKKNVWKVKKKCCNFDFVSFLLLGGDSNLEKKRKEREWEEKMPELGIFYERI